MNENVDSSGKTCIADCDRLLCAAKAACDLYAGPIRIQEPISSPETVYCIPSLQFRELFRAVAELEGWDHEPRCDLRDAEIIPPT